MSRQRGTLDQERWLELWSRLGARSGGTSTFARLTAAYAEPGRAYHTAEHIRDCLAELDASRDLAQSADEVEAALWFHDSVYLPAGSDNEEQSAELARTTLKASGVPEPVAGRIATLILATRHAVIPTAPDERLICDIDLSIFGRDATKFDEFERRIRREYAWVPEPVYRRERSAVLAGFLRRRWIYQIDPFRLKLEIPARANLKRLLAELRN
jgi:predicted metal-dependent HD superfamily phosphohydrolase